MSNYVILSQYPYPTYIDYEYYKSEQKFKIIILDNSFTLADVNIILSNYLINDLANIVCQYVYTYIICDLDDLYQNNNIPYSLVSKILYWLVRSQEEFKYRNTREDNYFSNVYSKYYQKVYNNYIYTVRMDKDDGEVRFHPHKRKLLSYPLSKNNLIKNNN